MLTPKRLYLYAVSFISLQSVAWAIISLLRNLFITRGEPNTAAVAFQIAVIVIGLPVFLVHWLWAQRLAAAEAEERESVVRRLYLFGNETAFLIPVITSVYYLLDTLMSIPLGVDRYTSFGLIDPGRAIIYYLIAIVILGILMYFHYRILVEDEVQLPWESTSATVRRTFVYLFTAVGLGMTATALTSLVRWVFFQIGGLSAIDMGAGFMLPHEISRLVVGLLVWIFFWRLAQRLFRGGVSEEQESALRKFYLYAVIFIAVLTVVTSTAFILSGFLKELMGIPSIGEDQGDIRIPLSLMVVAGVVWAYHALILREDERAFESTGRQLGVRRLYDYLVGGIGLTAFVIGISGDLTVFLGAFGSGTIGRGAKEEIAWFTAIGIIGLIIWILPWRSAQSRATAEGVIGVEERKASIRKIYLFFFLFMATMTILSSVVYLLYSFLRLLLGGESTPFLEIAQFVSYGFIAAGLWAYHGYWLREDSRRQTQDQVEKLRTYEVLFLDTAPTSRLEELAARIRSRLPGISIRTWSLPVGQSEASIPETKTLLSEIQEADLILGPWQIAVDGGLNHAVNTEVSKAIVHSSASKLMIPKWYQGWNWVGVEHWSDDALERQVARAVQQVVEGEDVQLAKPLGVGAIIGIVFGILFLLILMSIPIGYLLLEGF